MERIAHFETGADIGKVSNIKRPAYLVTYIFDNFFTSLISATFTGILSIVTNTQSTDYIWEASASLLR
jgi:hypothetical protein